MAIEKIDNAGVKYKLASGTQYARHLPLPGLTPATCVNSRDSSEIHVPTHNIVPQEGFELVSQAKLKNALYCV